MILHGDSEEELKKLGDNTIDYICTDPPYGYSFMQRDWDRAVPKIEIWQQCLRVLKPGGFMCVMSAPRSDVLSRMIVNIEDAGFRVDFTPIYWTYASGFPKAGNIGKLVDKRLGVQGEVIGQGKAGAGMNKVKGFGQNTTKGGEATTEWDVRSVASDQAKALYGSYAGFQPKPAVEVIIVAMKPLSEKTYVDQALANGKGIAWLDDGRIPFESNDLAAAEKKRASFKNVADGIRANSEVYGTDGNEVKLELNQSGRFPANLLVSDDVLNNGRVTGDTTPGLNKVGDIAAYKGDKYGTANGRHTESNRRVVDSGSYSRYFDLDKWASTLPFLITPKASKSEKNKGLEHREAKFAPKGNNVGRDMDNPKNHLGGMQGSKQQNHHPTVKPLKLMSYLITLFSRPGDTVLDPFVGSGTTAVAAQNLGRNPIGIEREAEYVEIAKARLAHVKPEVVQLPPEQPVAAEPPVTLESIGNTGDYSQLSLL